VCARVCTGVQAMRQLQLVGSLNCFFGFVEESYKNRALLPKRRRNLRSLQILVILRLNF